MTSTSVETDPVMSEDVRRGSPLLQVKGLRTQFVTSMGVVNAVNDVTFTVRSGDIVGLVGESGSGKTVAARSILQMVRHPGKVVAGSVTFDGQDLLSMPPGELRRIRGKRIAMVFQDPQAALNPVITVGNQLMEALRIHGASADAARQRAIELFDQVGIPEPERRLSAYPHEFSGGMRQRVVIAIALANKPDLLIADEPTTALDVTIQAQILALLKRLRDELGIAIILITHDMGVVREMCSQVVVMYGGRVVEQGEVAEVLSRPRHPYTAALLAAMPSIHDRVEGQPLRAIPGTPPDPARLPAGCAFQPRCEVAEDRCASTAPQLLQLGSEGHLAACLVTQDAPPHTRVEDLRPSEAASLPSAPTAVEKAVVPAEAPATPIVRVSDLRVDVASMGRRKLFGRHDPVFAVDGVTLDLYAGQTLGLVGESGCGKSTLSRAVVGVNPVTSGRVEVDGVDVTSKGSEDLRRIRSTVQYVFQDPHASLNPRRTVRQTLAEALELRGLSDREIETEAQSLIARVGLSPQHLDRYPHAFSGGQRQRVGIARALARQPRALILDEPVSALDVSIQAQIINLLEELQDELNLAYLFIAHDLAVVHHLSHTVAVMYLGRIVEIGPAREVYANPQHPYTVALLASSPDATEAQPSRERLVLRGDVPGPGNSPSGCPFRTRCPIGPLAKPERSVCVEQEPPLALSSSGQQVACHFPGELSAEQAGV